jgi:signal transduction histidine kinase
MGESYSDDDATAAPRETKRLREMIALMLAVQHELNNPLTALLAEAQLLELEPLADEHRMAAGRIVQLARRMVAAARRLDPGTDAAIE